MEIKLQNSESESKLQLRSRPPACRPKLISLNKQKQKKNCVCNLPNGYANNKFYQRYKRIEYSFAGCVIINLALILLYFQMSISSNSLKNWVSYTGFIFHFICIVTLFLSYKAFNDFKVHQNNLHELKKPLELIVCIGFLLIRPNPFLEGYQISFRNQLYIQYHRINDILCLLSLLEIFFIIPSFFIYSKFQSLRSQRISNMYGFKASYLYTLKCWFKENSTIALTIAFFGWVIVCSLAIRMAEYKSNKMLRSFENSMWVTFITMSTVGFGDFYATTTIGQIVETIAMYSGIMMVNIPVILLRNIFELNSRQKRTLKILNSLEQKNELRLVASQYLRQAIWRIWINKKNKSNKDLQNMTLNPSLKQRNLREQFRQIKKITQRSTFSSSLNEQFKSNFQKVYGYLQNLKENQESMIHYLQYRKS